MSVRTSPERIDQLVALLNAGQFDQLERAASDCARDHPAEGRAWQLLGVSHLVRGRHRDAVATLLRAVSLMPADNVSITVKLIAPIAMEEGLRFAIREGGKTVGAGVVAKIME